MRRKNGERGKRTPSNSEGIGGLLEDVYGADIAIQIRSYTGSFLTAIHQSQLEEGATELKVGLIASY